MSEKITISLNEKTAKEILEKFCSILTDPYYKHGSYSPLVNTRLIDIAQLLNDIKILMLVQILSDADELEIIKYEGSANVKNQIIS